MVLLAVTATVISAFKELQAEQTHVPRLKTEEKATSQQATAPLNVGDPISHTEILELWEKLKVEGKPWCLESLLHGSRVYVPPRPSKPEPTPEYKALMDRLRREEEARAYERMINPPPQMETFSERFPSSVFSNFSVLNQYHQDEDDEVTFSDINRQVAVIFNIIVSILACAAALWMVARHWATPIRLGLSMSGSLLVGVAEVVVYAGYLRKVEASKAKEKNTKEVKKIVQSWVVTADEPRAVKSSAAESKKQAATSLRARKKGIPQSS